MSDAIPAPARAIPTAPDDELVMSFAQERHWFMDAYTPGTTAYTIPEAWRLHGAVDPSALAAALTRVAERHEPLRTRFPAGADGHPRALVVPLGDEADPVPLRLRRADSDEAARRHVDAFMAEPFDLATGPVARALLVTLTPDQHVLAFAVHHIAADGWSTELVLAEILAHLAGEPLPDLPVRYRDFAAWQRALPVERDVAYWRKQLAGVPPLELPTDGPRPPVPTHAGAAHEFSVPPAVLDAVLGLGRAARATPYMVLLTAFAVLLGRRARQDDVTIGSPTAGRPEPELDDLVGCFVNMVPMRVDTSGDPTFVELLARVRSTCGQAFAHQELPFERLVTELNVPREVSRSPLFQVVFSLQSYEAGTSSHPSLRATADVALSHPVTRYDLELHTAGTGDFLMIYSTALFAADSIARLGAHLGVLLEAVAADPDAPISGLELLTDDERAQRRHWNDTGADLGPETGLHVPVIERAAATPHAPAVIGPGGELSHAEVDRRAQHLAARLAASGVVRGDLVAVVTERGWEQVVAVLAVNRAGAAYLPVDASLPERRRHELIALGGCSVAVTQAELVDRLAWPDALTTLPVTEASGEQAPPDETTPDDLAYVIFTSGSTGRPKGVMIEHRAALNTVRDITARFGVGPGDRVFALSALSFDLSVYDVYGTLSAGAALVMGSPAEDKDPAAWARTVSEARITVWNSVPALMELLVEHAERHGTDLRSLRVVMMSGDWIPPTLPDRIRALAPDVVVIGLGGATEASIWSIAHPIGRVEPSWTSIPYGRPLANQEFHVLDAGLCDVPVGVPGELYIGGAGLATGYWNDPDRTAAAFMTHPRTGDRLYRTGDLGRFLGDGVIEFLGRADAQVKIRGYRIELGEVEAHLGRHEDVAECVVATHGTGSATELVGYVETVSGREPDVSGLRAHLAATLPAYMVPASFVVLPRLPLTANGKVDRGGLPAPGTPALRGDARDARVPPRTETEKAIHAVWIDVLGRSDVGIDDDFFGLGGHSLLAIKVVERTRNATPAGAGIAVMDLFTRPTIRGLAAVLAAGTSGERPVLHRLSRGPGAIPELTYVAVPYGGGGAAVYAPLAEALPPTHALWSVAMPGHDIGVAEPGATIAETAARCVREIQEKVDGPVALYGHCGIGSALVVEIAVGLEAAGRPLEAIYIGGIFPFARPARLPAVLSRLTAPDSLRRDRSYAAGLTSLGLDLTGLEPTQVRHIVRVTREDDRAAEEYFTGLLEGPEGRSAPRVRAPVISVAGERDPASEYHEERFREWHVLSDVTALVLLDEAGHYFQEHRAGELAEIVTTTHTALAAEEPAGGDGWRLLEVSRAGVRGVPDDRRPGGRRFLAVLAARLGAASGAALVAFAVPIWLYLLTGSLVQFALAAASGLVPGVLVAPWASSSVDRSDPRTTMIGSDVAAGAVPLVLGLLLVGGNLASWQAYPLLAILSVALAWQRVTVTAAVPQLVPGRYLERATGAVATMLTTSRLLAPAAAVAAMAVLGLTGVLALAVAGCAVAVVVTSRTRVPASTTRRTGSGAAPIVVGFRHVRSDPRLRRMLVVVTVLGVLTAPLVLLVPALVLAVGTVTDLAGILLGAAASGALGRLTVLLWGGPRRHRMRGLLLGTLALASFLAVAGLGADLLTVGIGVLGFSLVLAVLGGIRRALVEVTVPHRFRGPVSELGATLSWSGLPAALGPVAAAAAVPAGSLLGPGGALAPTGGAVVGTGPERGLALLYVLLAVVMAVLAVVAICAGLSRRVDEGPAVVADDVIGLRALGRPDPGTDRVSGTARRSEETSVATAPDGR